MYSRNEKLNSLKTFFKEVDIHELLSELLPEIGFTNVTVTHERGNKSENGKDLICSQFDKVEGKNDWIAFVVKKGTVAGKSIVIQDIISQTKDCFEYEYRNVIKGLRFRVNKVKIVTNEHFSAEAKSKIENNNHFDKANIGFWDGDKLVDLIDEYYPKYWYKGSKQYKKYIERFENNIKTETISKTLGLNDKKVQKVIECAIEPKISERIGNENGSFSWKDRKITSIIQVPDNSIIIGEPGAGKSTFFKILSKEIIQQNSLRTNTDFYPILFTFSELKESEFVLSDALISYFNKDWNKDLEIDINEILLKENCVIFIDALDELPEITDKKRALEGIKTFQLEHTNIKVICSSRPSGYVFNNSSDLGFRYLEIDPLNRKQIEQFLSTYFADNLIKSKNLLKSLKDTGILEKLPKTALTIALITILFDEKEVEIPATITDLYRHFVDLLLGKYTPESTIDIIEIGIKHRILCHIAKGMHTNNKQSISNEDLSDVLTNYSTERGQSFDIPSLINDLITNTGLLYINEKKEVQFKHLSFQEYFTAYELFHHQQSDFDLFVNNFNNLWWQNVAIFFGGMSKDSPTLLQLIIDKSKPKNFGEAIINTTGLGKLLQALFNTRIIERKAGVERGLDNIILTIGYIVGSKHDNMEIWKNFSMYGLMQIVGAVFQYSYWSITLVEPIKQLFHDLMQRFDEDRTPQEQTTFEFKLFLLASILASEDFAEFKELKELVDKSKSKDLNLFALIETHNQHLSRLLNDEQKKDKDFDKLSKRINRKSEQIGDIEDKINVPINKLSLKNVLGEG